VHAPAFDAFDGLRLVVLRRARLVSARYASITVSKQLGVRLPAEASTPRPQATRDELDVPFWDSAVIAACHACPASRGPVLPLETHEAWAGGTGYRLRGGLWLQGPSEPLSAYRRIGSTNVLRTGTRLRASLGSS
jgi:hypothetical protein